MEYFLMFIGAVFVNNIVLAQFLGLCPFIGCSKEKSVSIGMGAAVVFVSVLATAITWLVQKYVLDALDLGYLQTIFFILIIAALVQFVEMFLKKVIPPLYKSLGIFLPLITTNCCVLGLAILVQRESFDLGTAVFYSFAASVGFLLALVLMAGIRERFAVCPVPRALQGTSLGLIMAGLMSLCFMAFKGMIQ
ncbi:MAG: RnfABCDGE type electron transport complex subunit A [Desulfovibrio sp.]|jgi:electron transport complex protein RnfA|nr:RnfABCDGE type electron transport complex subunit A [Desulfovibrio sp.]